METNIPSTVDDEVRCLLHQIADKWTVLVMALLEQRPQRFTALRRGIGEVSQKMLTQTLREMERDGLIDRKVYPVVPPMVEYSLTPVGRLFIEPLEMLYAWAAKNDDALSKLRRRRKKHTASRDNEVGSIILSHDRPGQQSRACNLPRHLLRWRGFG